MRAVTMHPHSTLTVVVNIETSEPPRSGLPAWHAWGRVGGGAGRRRQPPPALLRPALPAMRPPDARPALALPALIRAPAGVSWAAGFGVILGAFVVATSVFVLGALLVGYK